MSKIAKTIKKRFIISKSMLGKGLVIEFTNKKGETYEYNHDEVFANNQEKLLSMACFNEYGNYTNSNKLPSWAK
jgi:hypothetical protein|tara:strand:+ start:206 stop:427 length:222 start_codon:yes stop_codon:yes gene_type:complete